MIDNNTQFFKAQPEKTISVEGILEQVYLALKEKGYNPVNQIVGYNYVSRSNIYYKP